MEPRRGAWEESIESLLESVLRVWNGLEPNLPLIHPER